jgi:NMD protein affecting ribosome stability and mRNA decay
LKRHGGRVFDDQRHDPYQSAGKSTEPACCGQCGAVYHGGRWRWGDASAAARSEVCPACRRIHDRLPAGWLILEGPLVSAQGAELLAIIRNEAEHERIEHPLNRIMEIDQHDARIAISTTDIHLPQRIGEALKRAHHGDLAIQYGKDEYSVLVRWHG